MAGEAPAGDAAETLHFRLEVGLETSRTIDGRLPAPEAGSSLRVALLDLDGDGEFETRREFGETTHPRSGRKLRDVRLPFRLGDAVWTVELDALRSPDAARALAPGETTVHWSVSAGGLFVRFLGAPLVLHSTAAAARAAPPFRMGPPLRLEAKTGTRGPNPTVAPALLGPNGGRLCLVRRDGEAVRPDLEVLDGEVTKVSRRPGFS